LPRGGQQRLFRIDLLKSHSPNLWTPVPPTPDDLRRTDPTDRAERIRLVVADLERQWAGGVPKRVEEYVLEFPELNPAPAELIVAEYHARQRHGLPASADDYFARFPDRASALASLLSGTLAAPASFVPVSVPLGPGQTIDDFDLLALVGEGSFAKVFLARQRSLQRLVALKVSDDHGAEPQTLAQLDHPHLVRVYDQRTLPGRGLRLLYMPYLPGGTLRDVLDTVRETPAGERDGTLLLRTVDETLARRGEVPPTDSTTRQRLAGMTWGETVTWLGARLADALDSAHRKGVLHRDVKPANVLLGADASPRLADFNVGTTTVAADRAAFGGSIAYMSPEQLEAFDPHHGRAAGELDGRADVYSLAVMLWELLTGTRPYPVESHEVPSLAALADQRREPIPAASRALLPADRPPGLADVLTTALAANPGDRFATAGEFGRQLDLCLKPATRNLLVPKRDWRAVVVRSPLVALFVVGLVPNVAAALFNIEYNRTAIVERHPETKQAFQLLQLLVNGTFFPVCMTLFGWYCWPVVTGVRGAEGRSPAELAALRRRTLNLGTASVLVCLSAWVLAGAIFPLAMGLSVENLPAEFYAHFLASQTLSGLMAVAYPQFGVTFLALRVLYPRFVRDATLTAADAEGLRRVDESQSRYLLVAACVPMLAVGLLAGINAENRIALLILSAIGLVGFAGSTWLVNAIRADRAALDAVTT
jgi:serine/threonine protein kinase